MTLAGGALITFVPQFGSDQLVIGAALLAVTGLAALSRWLVGGPADRYGARRLLWPLVLSTTVGLCFVAWAMEGPFRGEWSWKLIVMLLYNGPLATAFAFWAAVSIQRALPSTTVSLSYLAVPAWGLAASTLWLGEALPASLVLGGLLILLGVAAIAIGDTRRR